MAICSLNPPGNLAIVSIYQHQTAEVEAEIEGDDGEITVKKKTTGGDPDLFKFFLERAWQFVGEGQTVGMVMSSGLHQAQGSTGLRRLMLDECRLRTLVKFDNEMRVFPGVHNQFKFDLVVFDKGGTTDAFDSAFFSREDAGALQAFREHSGALLLEPADIRRLSPQTLTFFEFKSRGDLDIVRKAYRLHPPFGQGLMQKLGLKYRTEFHMGNMAFLFRDREWLRRHGCTQEPGEKWRAADAAWYRSRHYVERPIALWYAVFDGDNPVDYRVPWQISKGKTLRRSDLDDFKIRLDLPGGLRLFGQGPDDDNSPTVFFPGDEDGPSDVPIYVPGRDFLGELVIPPCLRPDDVFLPLMEGKWFYQHDDKAFAYVSGSGSWVVTRLVSESGEGLVGQYFMASLDARTRTLPFSKIAYRKISWSVNERTLISTILPSELPCGDSISLFVPNRDLNTELFFVASWINSFCVDYVTRFLTRGNNTLSLFSLLPAPLY